MDTIHVVGDYGPAGEMAWSELDIAFSAPTLACRVVPTVVPKFNTIAAGFVAAQLSRGLNRACDCLLVNVDPRTDNDRPVSDGSGAPFVGAVLESGLRVFSPNAGHCLSFLKPRIKACYLLHDGCAHGQFRSRDLFPRLIAQVTRQGFGERDAFDRSKIADAPLQVVGFVDGYGNVKTTMTRGQAIASGWAPGKALFVAVGRKGKRKVLCASSIMGVLPGEFVLAPGSSGDPNDPFMEFAVRAIAGSSGRLSGVSRLGYPEPGTRFDLRPFVEVCQRIPARVRAS